RTRARGRSSGRSSHRASEAAACATPVGRRPPARLRASTPSTRRKNRHSSATRWAPARRPRPREGVVMDVKVPQLGESVTEGVIVRWLKEPGARVERDEPLLELETEKVAMEINADAAGTLEIVKPAGSRVRVGEVVARIAEHPAEAPPASKPRATPTPERPHDGGNGAASGRARESAPVATAAAPALAE